MIFINAFNYEDREIYDVRKSLDVLPSIQFLFQGAEDMNKYLCFSWLCFMILFRMNKKEEK